jgi:TRAP transporter TAXI family solute receptor
MRKRWLILAVSLIALLGLLASGCTKKEAAAGGPTTLKMGAGSIGGTWFPMMTATMVVLNEDIPGLVSTVVPGSSLKNARSTDARELDIALTNVSTANDAWNGNAPFEQKHQEIRALGRLLSNPKTWVVRADSGINSPRDLLGKKVNTMRAGSGTELEFQRALAEYGLTFADIEAAGGKMEHLVFSQATLAMKDGVLDFTIHDAWAPDPAVVEMETVFPVKIVPIDRDAMDRLNEKYAYGEAVIPGGIYKGTPDDTLVMTVGIMLIARADLPEEVAYQITKAIFENPERLAQGYEPLGQISPETGASGIPIPFHPGAERYFKEKGLK